MYRKLLWFVGLAFLPFNAFSQQNDPWLITASLGYGEYQDMFSNDGQTAIGRLAIGKEFGISQKLSMGLEIGVQSGNRMRMEIPQEALDILGDLPVQSTVKPMLDLLATARINAWEKSPIFLLIKGGGAYRRWQMDRVSVNDLSQLAWELQAGFGYQIREFASLNLLYQGIFGDNPNFRVNALDETGHVDNIPVEHALILGISVAIH